MPIIIVEREPVIKLTLSNKEAQAVHAALSYVFNALEPVDEAPQNSYEPILADVLDAFIEADAALDGDSFEFNEEYTADLYDSYALKQVK